MSNDIAGILFAAAVIWLVFGVIAGAIAAKKNRSQLGFFFAGFFFGPMIEQVNDLGPVLVVSQPSKPTMYLGFQFENAKIGALSDSDTVTQVRGGTKKFVATPLGGC